MLLSYQILQQRDLPCLSFPFFGPYLYLYLCLCDPGPYPYGPDPFDPGLLTSTVNAYGECGLYDPLNAIWIDGGGDHDPFLETETAFSCGLDR